MHEIPAALMRGGTSRGPVLRFESVPDDPAGRDAAALKLIGGGAVQTDALGGGSPTTSKLVLVKAGSDGEGKVLDYIVGNVVVGQNQVDWAGTCGNMTATVPLYALEEGLIDADMARSVRLRNLATNGMVRTSIANADRHRRGAEANITTEYLDPAGSVFDSVLPTGAALDRLRVDGVDYQASLVDVTHPYLFLLYDEVVQEDAVTAATTLARIERIRSEFCVSLGLVQSAQAAANECPAVPRVILIRGPGQVAGSISIHAISMGVAISSVPVTAALCMAAAAQVPSTIPARRSSSRDDPSRLIVTSPGASLQAFANVDSKGKILSAGVERTARTLMQGTAWI